MSLRVCPYPQNWSINIHCKNYTCSAKLLHTHTFYHNIIIGVSMEQIWCVYHTAVYTVFKEVLYTSYLGPSPALPRKYCI